MCASDISKLNHTLIAPVVVLKDTPSPLICWFHGYTLISKLIKLYRINIYRIYVSNISLNKVVGKRRNIKTIENKIIEAEEVMIPNSPKKDPCCMLRMCVLQCKSSLYDCLVFTLRQKH